MTESTADIIARMQERLRPHVVSTPATVRRLATDSHAPAGADDYGTRKNTMANRRNGGRSMYYRPRAEDFAGSLPATTIPASGRVKPGGGRKISNGKVEQARADSADQAYRDWTMQRTNLVTDTGDAWPAMYPGDVSTDGRILPRADDY